MKRKIDYKSLALSVVAEECRKSFFYFLQTFWDVVIAEEPIYNWHIEYLCNELEKLAVSIKNREPKPYDLIINIPPGTTKSTIVTIMFPAWLWTLDPTLRIITNSYSGGLSIEHATKSKDIIKSEKYQTLFPDVEIRRDKSGKQHYENTDGGFRYATSTGATITGFHAHVIINDDPVNPKQANSEALRLSANEHTKTLSSRKVDKQNTPMITIMQRLHEDDVTGYLLKKKGESIRHICLPAELSDKVKPVELQENYVDGLLDPKRLGREVLEEAKLDLGSLQYSGQYDQSPIIAGGNIVKEDWITTVKQEDFDYLYNKNGRPTVHFFVDTAFTEKQTNDPTGVIGAVYLDDKVYITSATKVRKEFPELITFLPQWVKANKYDYRSTIRIEPKANGLSVIQQLKQMTDLNITNTPSPTDSKETRLRSNTGIIECGRFVLVEGAWNEEFIDELCGFPSKAHDEYVDLTNYAIDYFINDAVEPVDEEQLINDFL